jgi:hypothetical protein
LLPFWHLAEIQTHANKESLEEALKSLPEKYAEVYEVAVKRIIEQTRTSFSGVEILGTVLHAKRRLTVCELQHALAFRVGDTSLDSLPDRWIEKGDLTKRTCGLVVIRDDEVQLAHQTVHQYLLYHKGVYAEHFEGKEKKLTNLCLHYIQLPTFQEMSNSEAERDSKHPFLQYAVRYVGHHAAACIAMDRDDGVLPSLLDLVNKKDQLPLGTLQLVAAKVMQRPNAGRIDRWRRALSSLHLAVIWHMNAAVESLLTANPMDIDLRTEGDKDETPLHVAARSANVAAVKMLLDKGANVHAINYSGKTALDMVMLRPYTQVQTKLHEDSDFGNFLVTLLLLRITVTDRDNEPPPESKIDRAAFEHGRRSQRSFLKEVFEESDSERHKLEKQNSTALILSNAVQMNITDEEEEIALMLIRKEIDMDGIRHAMETPLQLAAIYGRLTIVSELLGRGANPFIDRVLGWVASELAEQRGTDDIYRLIKQREEDLVRMENAQTDEEAKLSMRSSKPQSDCDHRSLLPFRTVWSCSCQTC